MNANILLASALCGLAFGYGLLVSGMSQPQKVLNFLDLAGQWDPTLAVVMAAGLAVTASGFALVRRLDRPLLEERIMWPTNSGIDGPLIGGAVLFGIGWGLVGLCPGPALVNLGTLSPQILVFVAMMIAGMLLYNFWWSPMPPATRRRKTEEPAVEIE